VVEKAQQAQGKPMTVQPIVFRDDRNSRRLSGAKAEEPLPTQQ